MLGKLIKHEAIADFRLLGPAYGVIVVLALLTRLATWIATRQALANVVSSSFANVLQGLASLLLIVFIAAAFAGVVLTIFYMIYRFYKNFFTDEGYLMMTLPAKPAALIFSKFINAIVWIVVSVAVSALGIWFVFSQFEELKASIEQFIDLFKTILAMNGSVVTDSLGVNMPTFVTEMCFYIVFWFSRFAFTCYFAIAFGQLISKNHKIGGAVLAYIVETIAISILSTVYMGLENTIFPKFISDYATSTGVATQCTLIGGLVLNVLISALLYWLVSLIMTRRLNLD